MSHLNNYLDNYYFHHHYDGIKFPVEITQEATNPAVNLSEAKDWFREDRDLENDMIVSLIDVAESMLNQETGYYFIDTDVTMHSQDFLDVKLPLKPFKSGSLTIEYDDTDGNSQTLSGSNYNFYPQEYNARVEFKDTLPEIDADNDYPVRFKFTVGYGQDEKDVPKRWKTAVKIIALMYWKRDMPMTAEENLSPLDLKPVRALIKNFKTGRFH